MSNRLKEVFFFFITIGIIITISTLIPYVFFLADVNLQETKTENVKQMDTMTAMVNKRKALRESFKDFDKKGYQIAIIEEVEGIDTIVGIYSANGFFNSFMDTATTVPLLTR